MTGVHIRYTDPVGKISLLAADDLKQARRLYRYAIKVATAAYLIELMSGEQVLDAHQVPLDIA